MLLLSDRPTSSAITVPPVKDRDVFGIALAAVPSRALTAQVLSMPRMLFTTSVESARPRLLGNDQQRFARFATMVSTAADRECWRFLVVQQE